MSLLRNTGSMKNIGYFYYEYVFLVEQRMVWLEMYTIVHYYYYYRDDDDIIFKIQLDGAFSESMNECT